MKSPWVTRRSTGAYSQHRCGTSTAQLMSVKLRQTKAALIIPERSPHSTPLLAVYLMEATLISPPRAVRADAPTSYYYSSFCSSLYMRFNSTRTTTASTLQPWLCTGPHPAGFSLPDQPQTDKTTCAASQCAGLQVKRSIGQLTSRFLPTSASPGSFSSCLVYLLKLPPTRCVAT